MRSHADIIREAGGADRVRQLLGFPSNRLETVKSWTVRDSIPAEYWRAFADLGICTLDALATAAAVRGRRVA